jgi:succinate dehydrogenase flavin-adding protein (antitoxin of CptAB toxin-antitoxin module)
MDMILVHFDCVNLEVAPSRYFKHFGFDLIAISDEQLFSIFDGENQMNEQKKLSVVFG